jgi:hypothetical protein
MLMGLHLWLRESKTMHCLSDSRVGIHSPLLLDYLLDFRCCYSQSLFHIGFQLGYRFGNLIHFLIVGGGGGGGGRVGLDPDSMGCLDADKDLESRSGSRGKKKKKII